MITYYKFKTSSILGRNGCSYYKVDNDKAYCYDFDHQKWFELTLGGSIFHPKTSWLFTLKNK